ncbi:MAG TPA: response regulator transcription factor [Dongiaceae bacterium]|jgi:DNA-binding response OmpR family regulator|nr:response regulator transcription factor [Dongiaceae bacterium]
MNSTSHKKIILLVDDDVQLRQLLAEQLAAEGDFAIIEAGNGVQGLAMAQQNPVDAIILDVGLPDDDGRAVCRKMRDAKVQAPILLLTGIDGESDTIRGLESGANDYITKPFRFAILLARLRAHLRQHDQSDAAQLIIGPYVFRPGIKTLVDPAQNKRIRLTEKETAILKFLYRAGNRPTSREKLLGEVWGYQAGISTHTLETHIYRLRQKIERDPAEATILVTDHGGYRLVT